MTSLELSVIESTADHAVGVFGSCIVYVWRDRTTMEGLAALRRAAATLPDGGRVRIALGLVLDGAPPPPSDVRAEMVRIMRDEWGRFILSSAIAFEGTGLRATLVRNVVTGLTFLARQPFPHKIFADCAAAARWLAAEQAKLPPEHARIDAASLAGALEALRRAPIGDAR